MIHLPESMSHNEFSLYLDLILPGRNFFSKCGIGIKVGKEYEKALPGERPSGSNELQHERVKRSQSLLAS